MICFRLHEGSCTHLSRASEDEAKQSSRPARATWHKTDALSPARSRQRPTNQSGRISGRTTPWLRTKRSLRDRPRLLIGADGIWLAIRSRVPHPHPVPSGWSMTHLVCTLSVLQRVHHGTCRRRGAAGGWVGSWVRSFLLLLVTNSGQLAARKI